MWRYMSSVVRAEYVDPRAVARDIQADCGDCAAMYEYYLGGQTLGETWSRFCIEKLRMTRCLVTRENNVDFMSLKKDSTNMI